jgi:hypothetical protein
LPQAKVEFPVDGPQFQRRVAHDYFVRFHMTVILAAVVSSGVLASKAMMLLGMSLAVRYPIAVLVSYSIFLLLVRIWIWYVSVRCGAASLFGNLNFGGGNSSGGSWGFGGVGSSSSGSSGFSGFGGGDSGGGGASSDWESNQVAGLAAQSSSGSSHSSWLPDLDFGGDSDGWWIIALLIALVVCILGGGVYLVIAAPHILPEAAAQVLLAGSLTRVSKEQHHNWMAGVIGSTWVPFLIVMVMAGVLGWEAHRYCPGAHRLLEAITCPGK